MWRYIFSLFHIQLNFSWEKDSKVAKCWVLFYTKMVILTDFLALAIVLIFSYVFKKISICVVFQYIPILASVWDSVVSLWYSSYCWKLFFQLFHTFFEYVLLLIMWKHWTNLGNKKFPTVIQASLIKMKWLEGLTRFCNPP